MPAEPLTDWEIKVLRGMIDEYRYKLDVDKFVHGFWTKWRVALAIVGGIVVLLLNVLQLVVAMSH